MSPLKKLVTLMDLQQLIRMNPEFEFFVQHMPNYIKTCCFIKKYDIGEIIHLKTQRLDYLGILITGKTRVINEFENGNVFMLETNPALDYIGEVTLLADQPQASVTIEAAEPCLIFCIPRSQAKQWLTSDPVVLSKIASQVAYKLYRRSLDIGMKLFYPAEFIFVDYLIKECSEHQITETGQHKILKTRTVISEEIGMNIKTLNRVITKLKNKELFTLEKGKITLTIVQFNNALKYLDSSKSH